MLLNLILREEIFPDTFIKGLSSMVAVRAEMYQGLYLN